MPEPGMVQLDPQKQAPASAETFDRKQVVLQAKTEVNILLEQSKSILDSKKAPENLQILSSFSVTPQQGREAETYDIYRQEVRKANELLIQEKSSVGLRLEKTGDGKLVIVVGLYEEAKPKVAEEPKEEARRAVQAPSSQSGASADVAAATSEREKTSQPNFTAKERKTLKVSAEALKSMGPLDMTESQWEVMKGRILNAAGGSFSGLSDEQKIEAVRKVVSPHEYEGSNGLDYPSPAELKGREVRKAAGTLSDRKGDCDDYTVVFAGCVKRLDEEGLLNVGEMKLALVDYYDPAKKEVVAHANALYVTTKGKDGEGTMFMVDLVYNTSVKEIGKVSGAGFEQGKDFREKFLAHLNEYREPENMITDALFQSRVYGGSETKEHRYDGVEFYYKERTSETGLMARIEEAEGHAKNAAKLNRAAQFDEAYAEHEEATQKFNKIIDGMAGRLFASDLDKEAFVKNAIDYASKNEGKIADVNAFCASVLGSWDTFMAPGGQIAVGELIVKNEDGKLKTYEPRNLVELGENSGGYNADVSSRLADLQYQKCMNLKLESNTLSQLYPNEPKISEAKSTEGNKAKQEWLHLHGQIMENADGLSAFALSHAAYSEFHMGHYREAEELAEKAIKTAPFKIDGYEAAIDLLIGQRRAGEIPAVLDSLNKRLAEIDPGEAGAIYKLRIELKEHVKKALGTQE